MPTTEPTPPIRELPDEIEAALSAHATTCFLRGVYGKVREGSLEETECNLRNAVRAALDERDTALIERCERLRLKVIDTYADIYASVDAFEETEGLHKGDLANDIVATKDGS